MRELGATTAQAMVDAFVRAELGSPRFGPVFVEQLKRRGGTLATLWNDEQSGLRVALLGDVRGYGRNAYLFTGFPADTQWRTVELHQPQDWDAIRYANHPTWNEVSGGSRLVGDGAANVSIVPVGDANHSINDAVLSLVEKIAAGAAFPELIAVEAADAQGSLVLVEGHTRATAYVRAGGLYPARILVGTSAGMSGWAFF